LSAGYGLRKETIAGVRHNGRDAPKAATPIDRPNREVRRSTVFMVAAPF